MADENTGATASAPSSNEYRDQRIANMTALQELGFNPYGSAFQRERFSDIRAGFEENKSVRAAGRLMTMRRMGKASFATVCDGSGMFQLFFKKDLLTEAEFKGLKLLDLGDFIGVEGRLFTTRTGERPLKSRPGSC